MSNTDLEGSRNVAERESPDAQPHDDDPSQVSPGRRQFKLNLGHLTGIPAYLIGVFWVCCSFSGMFDGYPYWRYDTPLELAQSPLPAFNVTAAVLLVVLQILSVYKVAILASNDRWQQPVRVRVPWVTGVMMVLSASLIASLLFCTITVAEHIESRRYGFVQLITGCVFAVIAIIHYTIILIGMLSRGRIYLHLIYERAAPKSSGQSEQTPVTEPYRDAVGNN